MRFGLISDTHGVVHPRIAEVFAGVDHILHAGDVGGDHVLAALRSIAPVTFVRGNNDDGLVLSGAAAPPPPRGDEGVAAPLSNGYDVVRLNLGGIRFLITHILPRPSKLGKHVERSLARERADVVLFGHSHLPHDEVVGGTRFFNPASAGPRRFDYPMSVGLFDGERFSHVALDDRSVAALKTRMNQMR